MSVRRAYHLSLIVVIGVVVASVALYAQRSIAASADSQTVLLLHADGGDATTVFSDVSSNTKTITTNGNAQIDTAQSKFGGSSALFDGTGDYVDTPDSADFTMGSGDFTVDFWFNRNGGNATRRFMVAQSNSSGADASASILLELTTANVVKFWACTGDPCTPIVTGTTAFTATGWHHVAAVRTGNTLKLFVDGTQEGGDVSISGSLTDSSNRLAIGRLGEFNGNYWNGWLDEVRISKGVARWTTNFTPPTGPYTGGITLTGNVKFEGNLLITGALSKSSGTFVIDHPLKPRTHLLYHSFVESSDAKNLYDGIATLDENGEAIIKLPDYFEALNKDPRYQFFPHYQPMPNLYVKEEVNNNRFTIAGGAPGGEISWQVTGTRHDPYILANPIVNEVWKSSATVVNRGECLFEPLCQ